MPKFQPGQSGNPAGRPKNSGVLQAYAREHYKEAIDTLLEIMRNKRLSASARATASVAVLDRGFGRPTQTIESNAGKPLDQMTDAEMQAIASGMDVAAETTH